MRQLQAKNVFIFGAIILGVFGIFLDVFWRIFGMVWSAIQLYSASAILCVSAFILSPKISHGKVQSLCFGIVEVYPGKPTIIVHRVIGRRIEMFLTGK